MINFRKARALEALKKADFENDAYIVIALDKYDTYHKYYYVKKDENINNYLAI